MKIYIANDHHGVSLKIFIANYLKQKGIEVENVGTDTTDPVDYPIYAAKMCNMVKNEKEALGIAICGTGIGISIACNKINGIRCAKVNDQTEVSLAKAHNNANVLALSSHLDYNLVGRMLDEYINTPYSNEERHEKRLNEIRELEKLNANC